MIRTNVAQRYKTILNHWERSNYATITAYLQHLRPTNTAVYPAFQLQIIMINELISILPCVILFTVYALYSKFDDAPEMIADTNECHYLVAEQHGTGISFPFLAERAIPS